MHFLAWKELSCEYLTCAVTRQIKNEQTKRIMKIFLVSVMGNVGLVLWPALVMLGQLKHTRCKDGSLWSNPKCFTSSICRCCRTDSCHLTHSTGHCSFKAALILWLSIKRADTGNHLSAGLICWPIREASGHGFYGLWGSIGSCGPIGLEHEPSCDPHACTSNKSI